MFREVEIQFSVSLSKAMNGVMICMAAGSDEGGEIGRWEFVADHLNDLEGEGAKATF